jgi:DNA-binding LacI/PurR family transcriptional regulator
LHQHLEAGTGKHFKSTWKCFQAHPSGSLCRLPPIKPTIADVAREARVGIGTVSRVLNASPLVSPATRMRVQAAMERLRYQPSPIARAFGGRRTHTIDVLVPLFAQAFFLELFAGIEDAIADAKYRLRIRMMETRRDRDRQFAECCIRGQSDGALVVWVPPTDSLVDCLTENGVPLVLVNAAHPRLSTVAVDHDAAAARAVTYCAGLGHRRIGLIDRLQDPFADAGESVCRTGYLRGLAEASLSRLEAYERLASLDARGGGAAMETLLALEQPPTAVIVGSDAQAIGALSAARAQGWRVPHDVSVVAYNDNDVVRYLGLTTIQVPLRALGRLATEKLLAAVADPNLPPSTTYLPTELVVRKTCAPPPPA